jgi:acyl-CoA thioesterase FadM
VIEAGTDAGVLTLIAHQEIEYLAPVPYRREPLDVQMWFGLGGSSIEVCYEVYSPRATSVRRCTRRHPHPSCSSKRHLPTGATHRHDA